MSRSVVPLAVLAFTGCAEFLGNDDGPPTPAVLITPQEGIDFGKVVVGFPSAPAELDVVGLGNTPPLAVEVSDSAYTLLSDDCTGAELVLGQVCKLRIQFVPATPGPIVATVTIGIGMTDLDGEGLAPGDLVADRQSIDFGSVPIDSSAQQNVTISNTGESPIGDLVVTPPPGFMVTRDQCEGPLAPLDSCELTIQFAPDVEGSFVGALSITGKVGAMPIETSVSLSGQGTPTTFSLTVEIFGNGDVVAEPGSLICQQAIGDQRSCSATYPLVELRPNPSVSSWEGDCSSSGALDSCEVVMDRQRAVQAHFDIINEPPFN